MGVVVLIRPRTARANTFQTGEDFITKAVKQSSR